MAAGRRASLFSRRHQHVSRAYPHWKTEKKIYANNRDRMHDINGIQIQFETERKSGSVRYGCVIFTLEIASKFS